MPREAARPDLERWRTEASLAQLSDYLWRNRFDEVASYALQIEVVVKAAQAVLDAGAGPAHFKKGRTEVDIDKWGDLVTALGEYPV